MLRIAETCLHACQAVNGHAQIVAGPKGRDGASVTSTGTHRILAFRATLTSGPAALNDWLNDFLAELVDDDRFPGRVHKGFLAALISLWPELVGLAKEPASDKPLVITGHSKGGALAILAGWLLRDVQPLVVTFAAPMCGDRVFAGKYTPRTWRFENLADIVPRLPPIDYWPAGMQIVAPASFALPQGIVANHALETGYQPWIV